MTDAPKEYKDSASAEFAIPRAAPDAWMGDRDRFLELIRRYGDKVYNFAYRLSGNEPDARDLVQEAFTRAFRNWERYDPSKPFDAWVTRILHNVYVDEVRRYERKHAVSYDAATPDAQGSWVDFFSGNDPNPIDALARRENDILLQKALAGLPVEYRTAVTLCDIENLSYEEISRVMLCPLGTVRSRIHQGRKLLRLAFEKYMNMRKNP